MEYVGVTDSLIPGAGSNVTLQYQQYQTQEMMLQTFTVLLEVDLQGRHKREGVGSGFSPRVLVYNLQVFKFIIPFTLL